MTERDSFARFSISKKSVPGACTWCGGQNQRGRVYVYTVEHDDGRDSQILGQFCNKACRQSYHN